MSSYHKITRNPETGKYEKAFWIDDYFKPHVYGVKFPSTEKVYPVEYVEEAQLDHFWSADVLETLRNVGYNDELLLAFLDELQKVYKARWKRDPIGGEGAYLPCEHFVQYGECVNCHLVIEDEE